MQWKIYVHVYTTLASEAQCSITGSVTESLAILPALDQMLPLLNYKYI